MAGVGVVLGAAALSEVEAMKGTVNELVTNQNLLVKQMVSVINATVVTAKNVEKLHGAVDLINVHAVTMKHVTTLEACVMGISTQISRFFSGLDTLLSGHLSLSLVKNVTESQFVAFWQAAQAKDYMLVFPSFTQVFEFLVSYFVDSGCLHILVDIPIVPVHDFTIYHLYKYKALPIFSPP